MIKHYPDGTLRPLDDYDDAEIADAVWFAHRHKLDDVKLAIDIGSREEQAVSVLFCCRAIRWDVLSVGETPLDSGFLNVHITRSRGRYA